VSVSAHPRTETSRAVIALSGRSLAVATGLAAALPVIISTIGTLSAGWLPFGDYAVVATRAFDVFTSDTPLVGAASTVSELSGEATNAPGPLLYWLLALPARIAPDTGFPVVMGALNTAAAVGTVILARRRGGLVLMFATAAAVAVMCAALPTEVLSDIWTPSAPMLSFTLLIFLCWSLACGEHRLLPLTALVASFVVQCHVTYVLPTVALLTVGLIGLVAGRAGYGPELRRSALAGLAVALVCWSFPLLDQGLAWAGSERGQGNLVNLVEASRSRGETAGAQAGAYAVVRAVGVPPWWLRAPQRAQSRTFEIFARPSATAIASAVLLLAGLAIALAVAALRRRWDVAAACGLALGLAAALAVMTAGFPNNGSDIFSYSYSSWWAAPAGMWVWLAMGWSGVALLAAPLRPTRSGRAAVVPIAFAGVATIGAVVAAGKGPKPDEHMYDPTRAVVERVEAALPNPGAVHVDGPSFGFESATIFALRRRGATVGTEVASEMGRAYAIAGRRYDHVLTLRDSGQVPPGNRLVARVEVPPPNPRTVTVSIRPTQSERAAVR
jgi:hypothetical protein